MHGGIAVLGGGGIWVVVSLDVFVWELVGREGIKQMLNSFRCDILRISAIWSCHIPANVSG